MKLKKGFSGETQKKKAFLWSISYEETIRKFVIDCEGVLSGGALFPNSQKGLNYFEVECTAKSRWYSLCVWTWYQHIDMLERSFIGIVSELILSKGDLVSLWKLLKIALVLIITIKLKILFILISLMNDLVYIHLWYIFMLLELLERFT